ncbi:MAG: hypothetical protein IPM71_08370 [Bacteroidota bacterium]|nr:MAG: hypothetical protein IPM71_08370 [Bacteroidota bacterium]
MKKLQKTSSELQKLSHDQMNRVRGGEEEGKPSKSGRASLADTTKKG